MWLGAPLPEIDACVDERAEHARLHGLRTDGLLFLLALQALQRGDWDDVLRLAEEGRSDARFSIGREGWEAMVVVAREGPGAGMARMDDVLRRGTNRLDPQDIAGRVSFGTAMASLAGDHAATLERADPIATVGTRHPGVDLILIRAMYAALRLGDRAAAARWSELALGRSSHFGHGHAAASRAFGEGVQALLAGDIDRAHERYLAAARALEEYGGYLDATSLRMERAELLARRGELDAARAEMEAVLPYWRRAKATWYLGRLRSWMAERGIAQSEEATATPA
jgi:hypothetical protein